MNYFRFEYALVLEPNNKAIKQDLNQLKLNESYSQPRRKQIPIQIIGDEEDEMKMRQITKPIRMIYQMI